MGDLGYLALAYGVIWLGLLVYLFRLAGRAEGLRRELGLLRHMLQADQSPMEDPPEASLSSEEIGQKGEQRQPA